MKPIRTFNIGSSYFFESFPDYKEKDRDELCIMDRFPFKNTNVLNMKKDGVDVFFFRDMDKEGFVEDTIKSGVPMRAGKFLNREFAEDYLKMSVRDLGALDSVFRNMDGKHTYETVIYEAYVANNGFYLTEEQLKSAYDEYKKSRPNIYTPEED